MIRMNVKMNVKMNAETNAIIAAIVMSAAGIKAEALCFIVNRVHFIFLRWVYVFIFIVL